MFNAERTTAPMTSLMAICCGRIGIQKQDEKMAMIKTFGGAVFLELGQTVFVRRLLWTLRPTELSLSAQDVLIMGATELQEAAGVTSTTSILQAYSESSTTAFLVAAGLSVAIAIGS